MIRIGATIITIGIIVLMVSDWMPDSRVAGLAVFAIGYVVLGVGIFRSHLSSAERPDS